MTPDLTTNYLGIQFSSPFLIGASPLVDTIDKVLRLEDAGVSGIVMHSLFEEQLTRDAMATIAQLENPSESNPEALSYFPDVSDYSLGVEEYLAQIASVKERTGLPVIASLNGRTVGGWMEYAKEMESAGADALELNVYDVPTDPTETGAEIEARLVQIVRAVRESIRIPLAIKLAPFYTSLPNIVKQLEEAGANGVVLFNRFYQPDLNIEELEVEPRIYLSTSNELLLRLRWMAILHGRCQLSLGLSGGIHHVQDAVKAIMAGADVLQVVSLILRQGTGAMTSLMEGFKNWMEEHEYENIAQMRGCLSSKTSPNPAEFERANYLRILHLWKN